ncbi:MAG: hypothetical protein QM601_08110 [Pseudoxanthomonas sp.]
MKRHACVLALALLGAACAGPGQIERTTRDSRVDQRLLDPSAGGGGAMRVLRYEMQPQERFRMPQPLAAATPQLDPTPARATLAPTTVCVHVEIDAQGQVQRVDMLDDRDECHAGAAPQFADLFAATQRALLQWRYRPAAVCTYTADAQPPEETDDCVGAQRVEEVPVSLMYAFTFEVRQGRVRVFERRVDRH